MQGFDERDEPGWGEEQAARLIDYAPRGTYIDRDDALLAARVRLMRPVVGVTNRSANATASTVGKSLPDFPQRTIKQRL